MSINTGRKINAWRGRDREREGEKKKKMERGREVLSLFSQLNHLRLDLWHPYGIQG